MMKAKEQFALVLRIIGVLGMMYVLRSFVRTPWPGVVFVIIRLLYLAIGAYFIRGAPRLVQFAYPEPESQPSPKAAI